MMDLLIGSDILINAQVSNALLGIRWQLRVIKACDFRSVGAGPLWSHLFRFLWLLSHSKSNDVHVLFYLGPTEKKRKLWLLPIDRYNIHIDWEIFKDKFKAVSEWVNLASMRSSALSSATSLPVASPPPPRFRLLQEVVMSLSAMACAPRLRF